MSRLDTSIKADNREDVFIGATVDGADEVVIFYRGNLSRMAVPA